MLHHHEQIKYENKRSIHCNIMSMKNCCAHWHEDYEIIFVLQGSLRLILESRMNQLEQGDIIWINPRCVHWFEAEHNVCELIQFPAEIIKEELSRDIEYYFNISSLSAECKERIRFRQLQSKLASLGLAAERKAEGYQFAMKAFLYQILEQAFSEAKYSLFHHEPKAVIDHIDVFERINSYISIHFREEFDISRLCKCVGMSKTSIYEALKDSSQGTIKNLLDFYRIEEAKKHLKNSNCSISYIASVCGFNSDAAFYRTFKHRMGVSPGEYRIGDNAEEFDFRPDYAEVPVGKKIEILRGYSRRGNDE